MRDNLTRLRIHPALAEAAAPLDAAQQARVAALEERLATLTAQLQQKRQDVVASTTQRLEEQNHAAIGAMVSAAEAAMETDEGASAAPPADTRLALASTLQQCTDLSSACHQQTSGEVQKALKQAEDLSDQIYKTIGMAGTGCLTSTDLAIVEGGGGGNAGEKENHDVAAALRRRREAQQQQAADAARQQMAAGAAAAAAFLTM